jgi:putative intracellular protease/amidase
MNRTRLLPLVSLLILPTLTTGACRPAEPERSQEEPSAASPAPAPSPPPPSPAAPSPAAAPPILLRERPLRAGFLVVEGVYNSELMAAYDVFQHTASYVKPGIEVFTVSPDGQPLTTFEGIQITPHHSFANAPETGILVVPSARGSMDADLQNQALIGWVRRTAGTAQHVVSLRDGAFVLAKAGLLDGVPATTFPDDYQRLVQMFPRVDLRVNVSFVDAGKILTSQGGTRSYDVAMHLVDQLYGPEVAQAVGKGLLIPWPPDPDTMTPRVVEHPPTRPPATEPDAVPGASPAPARGTGAAPPPA